MDKNNIPEEVTITPVIRDLERLFNRILGLVATIFGAIFSGLRSFISFSLKKFIPLSIILLIGMSVGYFSMQVLPRSYSSNMVIKLNVDAIAQLSSDIQYFESLIQKQQINKLATLFKISEEEAASLNGIELRAYSTYMEKVNLINSLYKNLDTATYKHLDFDELLVDDNPTLSEKFVISVYATDQKLFSKLEYSLTTFLERVPELNKLRLQQKTNLERQRSIYMKELASLDTLKVVFNEVLLERARASERASGTSINLGQGQQGSSLEPLKIYEQYMRYANEMALLDKKISNLSRCYEVYAHFSDFGFNSGFGKFKRAALGGLLFLVLAYLFLALKSAAVTSPKTND